MEKQTRETKAGVRHEDIYQCYKRIIKGHGKYGTKLPKGDLYAEVADEMHYSVEHVRKVICTRLKNRDIRD